MKRKLLALIWIVPFYSSITVSFKTMSEITGGNALGLPETWRLDNFIQAWELGIQRYILNSFIIVPVSVVGALFLSSLAGFALSQYRFPGNGLILVVFLVPGIAYGIGAGTIRNDRALVGMMSATLKSMGPYIVLVFFAAQFIEAFKYSRLGEMLAIAGGQW